MWTIWIFIAISNIKNIVDLFIPQPITGMSDKNEMLFDGKIDEYFSSLAFDQSPAYFYCNMFYHPTYSDTKKI
jgi:hypothetical protein